MSSYQFAGSLYRTQSDMLDAIAHAWVTSNGNASFDDVVNILANASDEDLTAECIEQLELNTPSDPHDPDSLSHIFEHGYEPRDLKRAFAGFREDINHDLDVEARGDGEMYEP